MESIVQPRHRELAEKIWNMPKSYLIDNEWRESAAQLLAESEAEEIKELREELASLRFFVDSLTS